MPDHLSPPALLAALLVVAAAWAPFASASQEEPDDSPTTEEDEEPEEEEDEEAEDWEEEEREIETEVDEDGFRVDSRRESDRGRDELRAEFELDEARLHVEFETRGDDAETSLRLQIDEWQLIEFRDEDQDGRFEPGEPVLQRHQPSSVASPLLRESVEGSARRIEAQYDLDPSGVWTLSFLVPTRGQTVDGLPLAATEIKFDLRVDGFPYRDSASNLAVKFRFQAESELEEGAKDGLPGLFTADAGPRGFLRWVNTSVVDGAPRPVGTSVAEARFVEAGDEFEAEAFVTFTYARGVRIHHDPSIGIAQAGPAPSVLRPGGDVAVVAAGAAVAVLLVAATLGPRFRVR